MSWISFFGSQGKKKNKKFCPADSASCSEAKQVPVKHAFMFGKSGGGQIECKGVVLNKFPQRIRQSPLSTCGARLTNYQSTPEKADASLAFHPL